MSSFSELTGKLLESQIQAKTIQPNMSQITLETFLHDDFHYQGPGAILPKIYQTSGIVGSGDINSPGGGLVEVTNGHIVTKSKYVFGLPQGGTTVDLNPAVIELRIGGEGAGSGNGFAGIFDVIPSVDPTVNPPNFIGLRDDAGGAVFVTRKAGVETTVPGSGWPNTSGSGNLTIRIKLEEIVGVLFATINGVPFASNVPDKVAMFVGAVNGGTMSVDTINISGIRKRT